MARMNPEIGSFTSLLPPEDPQRSPDVDSTKCDPAGKAHCIGL